MLSPRLYTNGMPSIPAEWGSRLSRYGGRRIHSLLLETSQGIVDKQIVDNCDFVIGIFGVRIGTPTGEAQSGTIEEIERLRKQGKHISLYFSNAPVPRDADRKQFEALQQYQEARSKDTLYGVFTTPENLRQQVSRHLPQLVASVHEKLRSSGGLETVEEELAESQALATQRLVQLALNSGNLVIDGGTFGPPSPPVRGPFQVKVEVEKQFPKGPTLRVVASQDFTLTQIDYLDEHNVKLFSAPVGLTGQSLEVPATARNLQRYGTDTVVTHINFRQHAR